MTIDNRTLYKADGLTVDVELENCFSDLPPEATSATVTVRRADAVVIETEASLTASSLLDLWDTRPLWGAVREALSYTAEKVGQPVPADVAAAVAWVTDKLVGH